MPVLTSHSYLNRMKAIKIANNVLSPEGVRNTLLTKLAKNEQFRYNIFRGRFREVFATDALKASEERITANFNAGLM